ncbi:MAG: SdpI family protein [Spirosomataceae bacterium]
MKTSRILEIVIWMALFIPLFWLAMVWNQLPDNVPLHFDAQGRADRIGSKIELIWALCFLLGGMALVQLVIKHLPRIDPKQKLKYSVGALQKIRLGVSLFMGIIGCFVVQSAFGSAMGLIDVLPFLLLIFIAFIGNYIVNVKPNYFVGIRTPWTLESESVWRKTHQVGGRVMFWASLIGLLPLIFIPGIYRVFAAMIVVFVAVIYPVIYSYRVYQQEKKAEGSPQ